MEAIYPSGPHNVPDDLTQPSKKYKRQAWLALISLGFFLLIYILLSAWFVWTSYRLLAEVTAGGKDVLLNLIVGLSSGFLALFMLKALFFIKKGNSANQIEITATEQPRLFQFLYQLADEAGAPRPKRVFVSPHVNAAVFYDLSILNLLFPSHKNLEIGLALINVLTISEVKAVLAHEFGHFAQRSMAIGSWVYIARQIAFQIIAKRDALDKFLRGLSRFDLRIAWIGWLLSLIVWSIRSLLDTVLRLVELAQYALSRQMEFQADLVAVSLTGSDELVHALHKLQAADYAWGRTIHFTHSQIQQGHIPHDFFDVQLRIIDKIGHILDDRNFGKTPEIPVNTPESNRVFKAGFAQPPQMWSTHPSNSDREQNAKRHYLPAQHDSRSSWLLFNNPEKVKTSVCQKLIGETQATSTNAEETIKALDQWYSLYQYKPRYRGAYLGRQLTRHVTNPHELYNLVLAQDDIIRALKDLYPEKLAENLARLRELEEESALLQALKNKVYQATEGKIVFRGREITRKELPVTIQTVEKEKKEIRQAIIEHDKRCRAAHLSVAKQLGNGWYEYLIGLIHVLHYAEHTLADLRDAHGLLRNVVAVVTADGKVSARELKRLIIAANSLQVILAKIFDQKLKITLDTLLCERLKIPAWSAMLEEFKLPPADKNNINDWMNVIEGWVITADQALSILFTNALEQLLIVEDKVALELRAKVTPKPAPSPSQVPSDYATLLPGSERKRQTRLGWWDRFQVADGSFATLLRLIVALSIVGTVLGLGSFTGTSTTISIYNGLGRTVIVHAGQSNITLRPFSAREVDIITNENFVIETETVDKQLIESFSPNIELKSQHFIYNVAAASPLVKWTANYGSAREVAPVELGAKRWIALNADHYFVEPPKSVKTKSGSATRTVVSGLGDASPLIVLQHAKNEQERNNIITAHATWDEEKYSYTDEWHDLLQ